MSEFRLLGGISYLIFCIWLGWYMWTMPDKDQREVGRAIYNSPTGQALVELSEALCELGQCPKCAGKARLTEQDFLDISISRAIKWVESAIVPMTREKTTWECTICGHIWNATYCSVHARNSGCPKCAHREGEGVVYTLRGYGDKLDGAYKIGHTKKKVQYRQREIEREYSVESSILICSIPSDYRHALEVYFHIKYEQYRVEGEQEWFNLPFSEVLYLEELGQYNTVNVEDNELVCV